MNWCILLDSKCKHSFEYCVLTSNRNILRFYTNNSTVGKKLVLGPLRSLLLAISLLPPNLFTVLNKIRDWNKIFMESMILPDTSSLFILLYSAAEVWGDGGTSSSYNHPGDVRYPESVCKVSVHDSVNVWFIAPGHVYIFEPIPL